MNDNVNHPSHYNSGKIEVIEAIEDWKLDYHLGNAVKYIARAGKKDPNKIVEDSQKALWYINRRIAVLQGDAPKPDGMPVKLGLITLEPQYNCPHLHVMRDVDNLGPEQCIDCGMVL